MGGHGGKRANQTGRPKGSVGKYPTRSKIYEALRERNFEFFTEYIALYRACEKEETREKLLMKMCEFLFPRLRPVDLDGNPDKSGEGVTELVKVFSEMLKK